MQHYVVSVCVIIRAQVIQKPDRQNTDEKSVKYNNITKCQIRTKYNLSNIQKIKSSCFVYVCEKYLIFNENKISNFNDLDDWNILKKNETD